MAWSHGDLDQTAEAWWWELRGGLVGTGECKWTIESCQSHPQSRDRRTGDNPRGIASIDRDETGKSPRYSVLLIRRPNVYLAFAIFG